MTTVSLDCGAKIVAFSEYAKEEAKKTLRNG
jgi:hypothetical protein